MARADRAAHHDTVWALEAASALEPDNAEYHARLAALDPSRESDLLAALALNPRNPSWWIMRSVEQEQAGDLIGAEASLLRANAVCRYYTPRWSLAAFYYRQHNIPQFTNWAHASLSVGYGDSESVIRMAQKLGLTPEEVRAIIPDDPEELTSYLDLMIRDGDMAQIYDPAIKLIDLSARPARDAILDAAGKLFLAGAEAEAVALWNKSVTAGWIPFAQLDPAAGHSLARGNFRGERIGRGFDWRYPEVDGVSLSTGEPDGSLRMELSGKQPPQCELASQLVPLLPGRKYRLTTSYRTESIAPGSGLAWSILPARGGTELAVLPLAGQESIEFETPVSPTPMELRLTYSRRIATVRIEGVLSVRSVELQLLP
jgi:hypothetical protein